MADRFQRLFSLEPNLYLEGCPIIIEAGALQKDTVSGKVLAQIKMRNIGEDTISSCKVSIRAFENNGNKIEGIDSFSYLDLEAAPGDEFGSKTPVFLPNDTARSFIVNIEEIVFSDKSVMAVESKEWKPVPEPKTIEDYLNDPELIKQYGLEVNGNCEYVPQKTDSLFLCTCGAVNNGTNDKCYKCGRSYEQLMNALVMPVLQEKTNERLQNEQAAREAQLKKKEETKKQTQKYIKIIGIAAAIIIVAVAAFKVITGMMEQRVLANKYNEANAAFENGDYLDAASIYDELGDYEDSQAKKIESIAKQMSKCVSEKDYSSAATYIGELTPYEGNNKAVKDAFDSYYNSAIEMIDAGDYSGAKTLLSKITYEDSENYVRYCDVALAVSQSLEKTNLSELYSAITALGDFNGADDLIKNNKYLSQIASWEGTWQAVDQKGWGSADDTEYLSIIIENGYLTVDSNLEYNDVFTVLDGKICSVVDWAFEKGDIEDHAYRVEVNNDTLMYDRVSSDGFIKCVKK